MYVVVTVNDENYKSLADLTVNKNRKIYCENMDTYYIISKMEQIYSRNL